MKKIKMIMGLILTSAIILGSSIVSNAIENDINKVITSSDKKQLIENNLYLENGDKYIEYTNGSAIICNKNNDITIFYANKKDDGTEVTKHYTTPRFESNVYEFDNGSAIVVNHNENIYELFIEELGDWSYECNNEQELFKYLSVYTQSKNNTGINKLLSRTDVIHANNEYQVYISEMGHIPYTVKNLNDVKNLVSTYKECIRK